MLVAKITPQINFSTKNSLLVDPSIISIEHMIVTVERMVLGIEEIRFSFNLGKLVQKMSGNYKFENYYMQYTSFTLQELSDWGTDDSVMLHKVASKIGVQVVEVLDLIIED